MRRLYSLLLYLLLPLIVLRLIWRGVKAPAYRERFWQRFGFVSKRSDQPIWVHAVSVGETIAIAPLVEQLLAEHPAQPIIITTSTPTGAERVAAIFAERVTHYYCPYDLPDALARFYKQINPCCLVIMETELWPNMIHQLAQHKKPVLLVNARLSDRSTRGYQRLRSLVKPMLAEISHIAAQSESDRNNFISLGMPSEYIHVSGSIKYDLQLPQQLAQQATELRESWGASRPVWVAASTHEGEEQPLIEAHKTLLQQWPELLLVLVPRHPERFPSVWQMMEQSGLSGARRSERLAQPSDEIFLLDKMGELMPYFSATTLAFVGGSLVERGGHNPLEPASLGKAVVMGPHLFNFTTIANGLNSAGALSIVGDCNALTAQLNDWLSNPERCQEAGAKGKAVVEANRGAKADQYQMICKHLTLKGGVVGD